MGDYQPADEADTFVCTSPLNTRQHEACPMRINGHSNESLQNDTICDVHSRTQWRKLSGKMNGDMKKLGKRLSFVRVVAFILLLICLLLSVTLALQTCYLLHVRPSQSSLVANLAGLPESAKLTIINTNTNTNANANSNANANNHNSNNSNNTKVTKNSTSKGTNPESEFGSGGKNNTRSSTGNTKSASNSTNAGNTTTTTVATTTTASATTTTTTTSTSTSATTATSTSTSTTTTSTAATSTTATTTEGKRSTGTNVNQRKENDELYRKFVEYSESRNLEFISLREDVRMMQSEIEAMKKMQMEEANENKRKLSRVLSGVDRIQKYMGFVLCTGAQTTRVGFSCYHFSGNTKRSWASARSYCINMGGDLVSVDSAEANRALQDRALDFNMTRFWIGLHTNNGSTATEACRLRRWVWSSNGATTSYTRWAPGEPNGCASDEQSTIAENCAEVWVARQPEAASVWNDRSCLTLNSFVCEVSPYEIARSRSSEIR